MSKYGGVGTGHTDVNSWEQAAGGHDDEDLAYIGEEFEDKSDDIEQKNYQFRAQVLVTLLNSERQRIMRSMLVVFERVWGEHKKYYKRHKLFEKTL